jgi:hypothetical protein
MINPTDYNLIAFKAITSFCSELSDTFGKQNHSLKLYERLISKTSISHDKAIKKHIDIFREFCIANRDSLANKDFKNLTQTKVEYSSRVFIDFNSIFKKADSETTEIIWKHLLTISALLDPAGNAKEILKKSKENKTEANFLTDIISKVESHVKPDSNPMEAVSAIMSSGVFTDLITGMNSGIQDGTLDLGKLMGTVQTMCSSLGGMQGVSGGSGGADGSSGGLDINMLTSMMGNLGGSGGTPPDLSQLTSILGPMLGGLNNKVSITEENTNDPATDVVENITDTDVE